MCGKTPGPLKGATRRLLDMQPAAESKVQVTSRVVCLAHGALVHTNQTAAPRAFLSPRKRTHSSDMPVTGPVTKDLGADILLAEANSIHDHLKTSAKKSDDSIKEQLAIGKKVKDGLMDAQGKPSIELLTPSPRMYPP